MSVWKKTKWRVWREGAPPDSGWVLEAPSAHEAAIAYAKMYKEQIAQWLQEKALTLLVRSEETEPIRIDVQGYVPEETDAE